MARNGLSRIARAAVSAAGLLFLLHSAPAGANDLGRGEPRHQNDLAVLVELVGNGLVSRIVDPSLLPTHSCHLEGDVYYTREAYRHKVAHAPPPVPEVLSVFSEEDAKRVFNLLAHDKSIPFGYSADGCYARAEEMVNRLFRMGHSSEKVWAVGGALTPRPGLRWNYHVAVSILVRKDNGQVVRQVIDPSLLKAPASPEEWLSKFYDSQVAGAPLHTEWPHPIGDTHGKPMLYFSPAMVYDRDETVVPTYDIFLGDLDSAREVNRYFKETLKLGAGRSF